MGLITGILFAPFMGPVYGVRFVLNALKEQVDTEAEHADARLQEELVALNMRLELGELTEEEFEAQESALLERIKAQRNPT